jgi:hypothetical protein
MTFIPVAVDVESSSSNRYQIIFDRIPNVVFNAIACQFPSMDKGTANFQTPTGRIPFGGTTVEHGPFSMQFILNESHSNYGEILHWMNGTAFPMTLDEAAGEEEYSDFSVSVRTNSNNPIVAYRFTNGFPTNLSPLSFDSQRNDDEPFVITATFDFTKMLQIPRS